jgi:glycerol uptake facilitator-like aquaporin
LAELIGTFWLTFAGCGSAVIAAGFPQVGIGLVGVSLAFGLTVLTMAYTIGPISGCHLILPSRSASPPAAGSPPRMSCLTSSRR